MTHEQVSDWLDKYIAAWKTYDHEAIGDLFSEEATYLYAPWQEPLRGRLAIVSSWLQNQDAPGTWSAEYKPYAVDGDLAVTTGVSNYFGADGKTVDREYWNVWLLRFDDDGRCREFTEYYMKTPKKADES
ncbi:MAG TPA: nuclear transport factor 2 family protein [Chloroflexia bacterium]|nr:nuclear transport factor 2 family protein [Chloroflexia bacterium]